MITREQFMLAHALAGVVVACDAPFWRNGEREEINCDPNYIENVATELAVNCSRMALENAVAILEKAISTFPTSKGNHAGRS